MNESQYDASKEIEAEKTKLNWTETIKKEITGSVEITVVHQITPITAIWISSLIAMIIIALKS